MNKMLKVTTVIVILIAILIIGTNLGEYFGHTVIGYSIIGGNIFETIDYAHNVRTIEANTAYFPDIDISTPLRTLLFLPFGTLFVAFAPFPWEISSSFQLIAFPEMLVWYILLPFVFKGILSSLNYTWKKCSMIILFILLAVIFFALCEGNAGTLFRHRSVITSLCLIFAAAGLAQSFFNKE